MTIKKSEIKSRVKKNVPLIWDAYPYAAAAISLVAFVVGVVAGVWWF